MTAVRHPGSHISGSYFRRTIRLLLFVVSALAPAMAGAQPPYQFTKIADTVTNPEANLSATGCLGLSNTGTVVISAGGFLWRGDGQPGSFTTVKANGVAVNVAGICPSINAVDEIAYLVNDTQIFAQYLVRNANGNVTVLAQSNSASAPLHSGLTYLPSLSLSGSAVYQGPGGIYIGPGGTTVVSTTTHPQLANYSTASMNDSLVAVFRGTNNGEWGVYRGSSAIPLVGPTGPTINFIGLQRPVINNAGTVAFWGRDTADRTGIFKTDDGVNFTFVGEGAQQAGHDRFSINNSGLVAWDGTAAAGSNVALLVGASAPGTPVISLGAQLDGSTVQSLFMWEESLNDHGQLAFLAFLADGRRGVYRADPNRPPQAQDGTLSVTAGSSASDSLVATDPDGNAVTFSIETNGTKGTATITNTGTGAYTYAANAGTSGTDTFTFTASDGFLTSNVATVAVAISPVITTCASDISATVSVARGAVKLNRKTGRYTQSVTLRNIDGTTPGPVSLVLDNLSSNATLFNASGATVCITPTGTPYINVGVGADAQYAARERASVTLEFTNPSGQAISYTTRVVAGSGDR